MPIAGSAKNPMVRMRKLRCTMKSASNSAKYSAFVFVKCVIDIAGLCVRVVGTGDVPHALRLTKFLEPRPAAVIKDPHFEIRIVEAKGADDCLLQDLKLLVVSRDVDVDRGQALGRHRPQPRLMCVGLGAPIALSEKDDVEDQCIADGQQLDGEAKPYPPQLIPGAVCGQNGRKEPPVEVPADHRPDSGENQQYAPTDGPSAAPDPIRRWPPTTSMTGARTSSNGASNSTLLARYFLGRPEEVDE